MTLQYVWQRSDQGIQPTLSISFQGAGQQSVQPVTWTLSSNLGQTFTGSEDVALDTSSGEVLSNQAAFSLTCQPIPIG